MPTTLRSNEPFNRAARRMKQRRQMSTFAVLQPALRVVIFGKEQEWRTALSVELSQKSCSRIAKKRSG